MSVYSDWKCGALSDSDYKWLSDREARRERYLDEWERYELEGEKDNDDTGHSGRNHIQRP